MKEQELRAICAAVVRDDTVQYRVLKTDWCAWYDWKPGTPVQLFDQWYEWRVKPNIRTILITYPEPETVAPPVGTTYWFPNVSSNSFTSAFYKWGGDMFDRNVLERGCLHLSEENAAEHGKAIAGEKS